MAAVPACHFQSLNLRPEIGGNSYALQLGDESLILDAGMHPKEDGASAIPRYDELPDGRADGIIITHSHLDHIGTLPVLQEKHPEVPVYLTAPTAALGEALLHNSVNVMKSQRSELGIPEYPLYTHPQIDRAMAQWFPRDYDRPFLLNPLSESSASLTFHDAGHIMGSAGISISAHGRQIFYTGDVHFADHTLTKGARFPDLDAPDLLIMECTRGSAPRSPDYSLAKEQHRLASRIAETIARGGSVLIPVFAIGKTQETLTMLHGFKENELLPEQTPIIIGGLSTKMTILYDAFASRVRRTRPKFELIREMELPVSRRPRRSKPIEYRPGVIYAVSSGMMSEHTVSNTLARQFLSNPA
ncbi:MAG: MBL fold metallo-hydrolase, partial [Verrucomicrobiales bacterium]